MPLAKTTTTALVAAGGAIMLVLTGCSGSTDDLQGGDQKKPAAPKGAVYDFTQINGMPPAKEITFQIPDPLLKADPEYAKDRVLTSVTAKAHQLDSAEYCAVDLTFSYADGARDRALTSKWYDAHAKTTRDGYQADTDPPPAEKIANAVGDGGQPDIGQVDPSQPDFGTADDAITEDFQTLTDVVECATGPTDTDDNAEVYFNLVTPTDIPRQPDTVAAQEFGTAEVAVMKNGDLSVVEGEIEDWMLDANGDWIPDD